MSPALAAQCPVARGATFNGRVPADALLWLRADEDGHLVDRVTGAAASYTGTPTLTPGLGLRVAAGSFGACRWPYARLHPELARRLPTSEALTLLLRVVLLAPYTALPLTAGGSIAGLLTFNDDWTKGLRWHRGATADGHGYIRCNNGVEYPAPPALDWADGDTVRFALIRFAGQGHVQLGAAANSRELSWGGISTFGGLLTQGGITIGGNGPMPFYLSECLVLASSLEIDEAEALI